jgi:hypothetical protein
MGWCRCISRFPDGAQPPDGKHDAPGWYLDCWDTETGDEKVFGPFASMQEAKDFKDATFH